jgi:hypothetical protein
MPDLYSLDLYEHEGHLHQLTGSLSADELLEQERYIRWPFDPDVHAIRAFVITEHRSRFGAPLAKVASLQDATLKVLQTVHRLDYAAAGERPVRLFFTYDPSRRSTRRLRGRDFAENFSTWLRTADADETLVEVPADDPASIAVAIRDLRTYLGRLRESLAGEADAATDPARVAAAAPVQRPLDGAAAHRQALSRDWPTAADVSRQLGSTAENASHRANQLRRDGQLLGVWLPPEQAYRFPAWQFGADGLPVPQLAELLALLRGPGGMAVPDRRTSGWGEVEWFLTPHALLDGASPAEVLASDPAHVLAVAQDEFQEPAHARW